MSRPIDIDRHVAAIKEDRLWRANDWTARVLENQDDPHALLVAHDGDGVQLAHLRVAANFRHDAASAAAWIDADNRRPG